jgi:hypothetical protein
VVVVVVQASDDQLAGEQADGMAEDGFQDAGIDGGMGLGSQCSTAQPQPDFSIAERYVMLELQLTFFVVFCYLRMFEMWKCVLQMHIFSDLLFVSVL